MLVTKTKKKSKGKAKTWSKRKNKEKGIIIPTMNRYSRKRDIRNPELSTE